VAVVLDLRQGWKGISFQLLLSGTTGMNQALEVPRHASMLGNGQPLHPIQQCRSLQASHQPRSLLNRPEIQARHTAFKRGSAYLERYCLLIAFTAYLEDRRRRRLPTTFEDWMEARPDLCQARNSILNNPAGQ
jgi:hypothetical protein